MMVQPVRGLIGSLYGFLFLMVYIEYSQSTVT